MEVVLAAWFAASCTDNNSLVSSSASFLSALIFLFNDSGNGTAAAYYDYTAVQ